MKEENAGPTFGFEAGFQDVNTQAIDVLYKAGAYPDRESGLAVGDIRVLSYPSRIYQMQERMRSMRKKTGCQ